MNMQAWPQAERPREKLLQRGAAALSDAELLAIFIRTGIPGQTALDIARDLLRQAGGLGGLLGESGRKLLQRPGIGPAKSAQIQAAMEMGRRVLEGQLRQQDAFTSADETGRYLAGRLAGLQREVFCCLFLDNRHRLLAFEELFQGSLTCSSVHPRVVVQRALHWNAAAVIVAHNHPSGVSEPSQADLAITRQLRDALALVEVRLLDHVIVGAGRPLSLAAQGQL